MQKIFKVFLTLFIACFLISCSSGENSIGKGEGNGKGSGGSSGGGEGSSGGGGGGSKNPLSVSNCGVSACTGSGTGIWRYKNNNSNATLKVSLSNVADRDITIVFTNVGANNATLTTIPIGTFLKNEIYPYEAYLYEEEYIDTLNYIPDEIRDFKVPELTKRDNRINSNLVPSYKTYKTGDERDWNVPVDFAPVSRTVTLKKQIKAGSRTVNIWVENGEYDTGKIDNAKVNKIASSFNTVYSSVVGLIGEIWGEHEYNNRLISDNQPLDVILLNFNRDGQPFGTVGYFWSRDNFFKTVYANSNEALAIAVDTETFYLYPNGELYTLATVAHELVHAVNFYQRYVLMDDRFDTFLDEMSAVMMEDIISSKISFNEVSSRYKSWLKTPLYHQSFADWKSNVSSYNVAGSFGAYLLRQYGTKFYKTLFQTKSDSSIPEDDIHAKSIDILNKAIKTYNNEGLKIALQHWGASIAMLPAETAPKGFGYPAKNDGSGFKFEVFDAKEYKQYRALPTSSPSILEPYAHFPFLRRTTNYRYEEIFTVPENVSVTIVVQ